MSLWLSFVGIGVLKSGREELIFETWDKEKMATNGDENGVENRSEIRRKCRKSLGDKEKMATWYEYPWCATKFLYVLKHYKRFNSPFSAKVPICHKHSCRKSLLRSTGLPPTVPTTTNHTHVKVDLSYFFALLRFGR